MKNITAMKRILLVTTLIFAGFEIRAQQKVEAGTEMMSMSKGEQFAFTVIVPEAKAKKILNRLGKSMSTTGALANVFQTSQLRLATCSEAKKIRRTYKLKVEKNGDEFYVRAIKESSLTKHPIDVYARITELSNGCKLSALLPVHRFCFY